MSPSPLHMYITDNIGLKNFATMAAHAGGKRVRIRAHVNPLSTGDYDYPCNPDSVDWHTHYPEYFAGTQWHLRGLPTSIRTGPPVGM